MQKFCLLALLCLILSKSHTQIQTPFLLKGQIRSAANASPLSEVWIYLSKARVQSFSDSEGKFQLTIPQLPDTLIISLVGYTTKRIALTDATFLDIQLEAQTDQLSEVEVHTGYQSLPAERATGSFTKINSELFNRKISANILDRLDGIASGLIFNRSRTPNANESAIQIRGRSTLFANTDPLIIVDNFPYEGDINQLNPNDIESITLLKDAAAASIWGVRAGNGVIVITTKKAKQAVAPRIQFNSNITIGEKPNLYYQPIGSATDLLEIESLLFNRGFHNNRINQRFPGLSPIVSVLEDRRAGRITAADSALQMQQLLNTDNRAELSQYFYRPSVTQQYALSITGGSQRAQYYLAAGWDKAVQSQWQHTSSRITLRSRIQLELIPDRLELSTDLNLITSTAELPSSNYSNTYPIYQSLVSKEGKALPIYRDYRKNWLDTIGQNQLLPWDHKPYEDIRNNNHRNERLDTRLLTSLNWKITKGLSVAGSYQFESGNAITRLITTLQDYTTRDLINRYTQLNYTTGIPTYAIPIGDILNQTNQSLAAHNGRVQLSFNTTWKENHKLQLIAGAEIRQFSTKRSSHRRYGVNQDNATDIEINPISTFPTLPANLSSRIPTNAQSNQTVDRFLSQFLNMGYTFKDRYQWTLSARKDASNLLGVETNQQSVPLWSMGTAWSIHKEPWWRSTIFNTLKFRVTYGVSGNIDKSATAFTTAGNDITSFYSQPTAFLINPPNPKLTWEKIRQLNLGLDFSALQGRLSGSLEYYQKNGKDLIGASPVAPQTGVTQFRQNIADLRTTGWDLTLNAIISKQKLSWNTQLLGSYNSDKIIRYLVAPGQTKFYLTNITSNPYEGKPWSAIFAYPMFGLDPTTGNPMGWLNGTTSTNYNRLVNPASKTEFEYIGSGRPTFFGGWRNDFAYKKLSLSINIVYSLGYYFRRPSVQYSTAYNASQAGTPWVHADFQKRWRNPGDEAFTQIPSMIFPSIAARDEFYQFSKALIEKGDHIRLRDIRLSWDMPTNKMSRLGIRGARIYSYINNIAILWRANKANIDPDNITGFPTPRTYAIGLQLDF